MPTVAHLFGLLPEDVSAHFERAGLSLRPDEARRVVAHAISERSQRGRARHPLSRQTRAHVERLFDATPLQVVERREDQSDGFVRYLFRHPDGATSEAVRIPLEKEGHFTVCLSSQVGCGMGCAFCATGRMGLTRNLESWEMIAAFCTVRDDAPGRVSGAVFMGQGEPLQNYDAVLHAADILRHPCGGSIRAESISISTVGLPAAMRRFARDGRPYRLILSLTSAIETRRATLVPIAERHSLADVADALGKYAAVCNSRVTVAWVLMAGINTGVDEVEALRARFGHLPLRINLIDVNDARADGFRPPDDAERNRFIDALRTLGFPVVRRYSGGRAEHAACGMLSSHHTPGSVDAELL